LGDKAAQQPVLSHYEVENMELKRKLQEFKDAESQRERCTQTTHFSSSSSPHDIENMELKRKLQEFKDAESQRERSTQTTHSSSSPHDDALNKKLFTSPLSSSSQVV
jgi:hypothetical protein